MFFMYEIDNQKFGRFVAALRKEKGYTQKELCDLIRKEKAHPCGIIAAPVGFVHVCESKHMVKPFSHIPKLIVEGRKGGSNLAATLVNAILTFDDAEQLKPGRDV